MTKFILIVIALVLSACAGAADPSPGECKDEQSPALCGENILLETCSEPRAMPQGCFEPINGRADGLAWCCPVEWSQIEPSPEH